jgi:PKD repeat protein
MQPGEQFYFQIARLDDVGAATKLNLGFAPCTVACTAGVPGTGTAGAPVSFTATATPTYCPLPAATYAWSFGDGSPVSTAQSPQHTYATAGPFDWSLTVTVNGVQCHKNGSITISALPRGDGNGDGTVNVQDVFYLINSLFAGGPDPVGACDVNGDSAVNVQDVFYLINYLFAGGPAPV